jgi:hypothetical protein
MTKNEQLIANVKNIFKNLNEKLYIGFSVVNKYGDKRLNTRIIKYNESDNACFRTDGKKLIHIEYGLSEFLSGNYADTYEIKVKKSCIMFRWQHKEEMTNWRMLTFSVVK